MAQTGTPQSARPFSSQVAGLSLCLYGLMLCAAVASDVSHAPPPAAADSHKPAIHAVLPPAAFSATPKAHETPSPVATTEAHDLAVHKPVAHETAPAKSATHETPFTAPVVASHEPTAHETEHAPPQSAAHVAEKFGEKTLPFELGLTADPDVHSTAVFILKLKRLGGPAWPVGEVLIWWTTPNGRKTSIAMKQLSDDVWASRVALEKPEGRNRLTALILGDSERDPAAQTVELSYEAELPGGPLQFVRQRELGKIAVPAPEEKKEKSLSPAADASGRVKKEKSTWSVQAVVILVGMANLLLLLPGLILAKVCRRIFVLTNSDAEIARKLYAGIFSSAGLIGRDGGQLCALDADVTESLPEKKPLSKEMFEATVLEPAAAVQDRPREKKKKEKTDKDPSRDGTIGGGGSENLKVDLTDLTF